MGLEKQLNQLAESMGAYFFGIANLVLAHEAIRNLWEEAVAQFPRAISVGIALSRHSGPTTKPVLST